MNDRQTRVVETREQAHVAAMQAYAVAKLLIQDGKRAQISVSEDCDPISIKQRRFLHGPVFGQISEQVRVCGERYVMATWKEFFRKLFLPDRYEMRRIPVYDKKQCRLVHPKRATPYRVRSSTEDLNVKNYSGYIDKVIQHATLELNVVFDLDQQEREAVRYVKPVRAKKQIVDAETGEIMMEAA